MLFGVVRRMGGIIMEGVCSVLLICIMTRGGRKEGRKERRKVGGGFIYFVFVVYVGVFPRRKVVDCNFLWVVVSRYGIVLGLGI